MSIVAGDEQTSIGLQISVVVCSYGGAASIGSTLQAMRGQTLSRDDFEVIVVDDGSLDATATVAAAAGADRVVRLEPNRGLAAARNAGVAQASAALVAFTDDDCIPHPRWLAELVTAFKDPLVDGVGGSVEPADTRGFMGGYLAARNPLQPLPASLLVSNGLLYRLKLYLQGLVRTPHFSPTLYSVVGANMAFRATVLQELEGFDEAFRFGGEEEELCHRGHARKDGIKLRWWPGATVRHPFDLQLLDTLRRARAYGIGNARLGAKHRDVRLIVFPGPVLTVSTALVGLVAGRRRVLACLPVVPLLAYVGWIRTAIQQRRAQPLLYPYVQFAQETATMVGEAIGVRRGYARSHGP